MSSSLTDGPHPQQIRTTNRELVPVVVDIPQDVSQRLTVRIFQNVKILIRDPVLQITQYVYICNDYVTYMSRSVSNGRTRGRTIVVHALCRG